MADEQFVSAMLLCLKDMWWFAGLALMPESGDLGVSEVVFDVSPWLSGSAVGTDDDGGGIGSLRCRCGFRRRCVCRASEAGVGKDVRSRIRSRSVELWRRCLCLRGSHTSSHIEASKQLSSIVRRCLFNSRQSLCTHPWIIFQLCTRCSIIRLFRCSCRHRGGNARPRLTARTAGYPLCFPFRDVRARKGLRQDPPRRYQQPGACFDDTPPGCGG